MLNPIVKEKYKSMFNTFKTKINDKCKDLLSILSSLMHVELKENLITCLHDKVGSLRLFQMERMVVRASRDSTILTNDPSIPNHVVFNKDYIDKYIYDCGFFSYEEIGKILYSYQYLVFSKFISI